MKIYFGIRPPARLRKHIASAFHSHVKRSGLPLRVQHAHHMHITTHFIGEVTEKGVNEISARSKRVASLRRLRSRSGENPTWGHSEKKSCICASRIPPNY